MAKLYLCEIPNCGRNVAIRSTVKTGEFKGKKCCPSCKNKLEPKAKVFKKPIKKITDKNLAKRKTEREGLPEFFAEAISLLKINPRCQNCGVKIKTWLHPVNNIAHLLRKSYYKSVMTNKANYVFLCDSKDNPDTGRSCHHDFDNKISERPLMPVFETVIVRYRLFKDEVLETGVEKSIYDSEL